MPKRTTNPAVRIVPYTGRSRASARTTQDPARSPYAAAHGAHGTDGALALSRPAVPAARRPNPLRLVRPDERAETDLRAVAEATVRLVAEVLAGMRTPHHLAHQALPEVCRGLAGHRAPTALGARIAPPQVLTTWLQEPAPGSAETGAVLVLDGRVQALALRLEHRRGRWRCTAVETSGPAHRRRPALPTARP
ncbi:Rv3235 family protein [Spirillospora sp. NBC_01491]|uniref:Rv3235 family protein n=1 Tax=Spirillospora sp. NBC_01491 TaxID=2976007 RepID=UPI002E2FA766|nr:Rv3235 family protein [Spirillospora sp. NBC_01491]